MKRQQVISFLMVGAFGLCLITPCSQVLATTIVHFNDGAAHDIDYAIYNTVYADHQMPGMKTEINLWPAGSTDGFSHDLKGYGDSRINVLGGSVGGELEAHDNSFISMTSGWVGRELGAHDFGQFLMTVGTVEGGLYAINDGRGVMG